MTTLTAEEIDDISDVGDAMMKGIELDIPMDGVDSIEEMKARLKCHFRFQQEGSLKVKMDTHLKELGETDRRKREQLEKLIKEVENIFLGLEMRIQMLESLLSQDGTTVDIRRDCEKRMGMLRENECCILVSGEASAGKSSILNLLLGEEILPSHVLPCTSAITVIKYGTTRHAKVLYKDGTHTDIPTLDEKGLKQLHAVAFIQSNSTKTSEDVYQKRRDGHDITEIQVYLPLTFLESGLVLLDTPGIGENEFLEGYLLEYIRTHQILGFLYIIMSDAAKCVAEDRLVSLMSLILKHQTSSTQLLQFDPRAALFVLNRWDMVQDKKAAARCALESLGRVWPEFNSSQAVFFSTFHAKREIAVNCGYVTEDYASVLNGLSNLMSTALDRRIKTSFRWLGNVLQRTVHYLRTIVRGIDMSERERELKRVKTTEKLHILKTKSEDVTKRLRKEVDKAVHEISDKIKRYLKTPQAKLKLTTGWGAREDELPDLHVCSGGWYWIKRHIDMAVDLRLLDLLEDWEKVEQCIPDLEEKICRDAKLNLSELENELSEIEKGSQKDATSMVRRGSFLTRSNSFETDFTHVNEIDEPEKSLPRKLASVLGILLKPIFRDNKEDKKIQAYIKDKAGVAKKRAEKKLKRLQETKDELPAFIIELMRRPLNYIVKLETKIPNMIISNERLLNSFEDEIMKEITSRKGYIDMMTKIEAIRRGLLEYGDAFLFANDFDEKDVQLLCSTANKQMVRSDSLKDVIKRGSSTEESTMQQFALGIWTSVHLGKLKKDDTLVSVKVYNPDAGVEHASQEVAKLRCLLHKDVYIAEFLGIYQIVDAETPAQIYNGHLMSLRRYLSDNRCRFDVDKLTLNTLAGLRYLHSKGLVHMELTQDTLTVNAESGEVQLSGACLPRKAKLPVNLNDAISSEFVYLPKEVLLGEIYTASSDVYCFALLCIDIQLNPPQCIFESERQLNMDKFLSCTPSKVLELTLANLSYQKDFKQLLRKCLDTNLQVRPNAFELWDMQNRNLEKTSRRFGMVNGPVTHRTIWSSYRTQHKLKS